jgi:hypothetical protein
MTAWVLYPFDAWEDQKHCLASGLRGTRLTLLKRIQRPDCGGNLFENRGAKNILRVDLEGADCAFSGDARLASRAYLGPGLCRANTGGRRPLQVGLSTQGCCFGQ